jgi:hypothetical protein
MDNLKLNYEYFKENYSEITKKHIDEYVVIKDCVIIGYYKTQDNALAYMKERGYELGTFIVQRCYKNLDDNKVVFHSRVLI